MCALRVLAARDIAAKGGGAAGLDRAHHLQLCVAHVAAIGLTPSGTEVAEDVRDFQSGTLHGSPSLLGRILIGGEGCQHIKWACNLVQYLGRRAAEER